MNGCFAERADVIHLVLPAVIAAVESPALVGMFQFCPCVQITIRVSGLCRRNTGNITVDPFFQRGIGMGRQEIGRAADHFIDQSVIPRRAGVTVQLAIADAIKIIERAAAVIFELVEAIWNGDFLPDLALGRPEGICDRHCLNRHRGELIGGLRGGFAQAARQTTQHSKNNGDA